MRKLIYVAIILLVALVLVDAKAGTKCPIEGTGKDCEVVRVVTRCDVDKQKLRSKILKLEKQLAELENKAPEVKIVDRIVVKDRVVVKEKIVTQTKTVTKIKRHILNLLVLDGVKSIDAYKLNSNTAKAEVETGPVLGVSYQFQFDSGIVPLVGASFGYEPKLMLGLGYEF
jgi:hypothetical protein